MEPLYPLLKIDGWMKDRQKVQSTFLSRQIVLRAGQYSLGEAKNLGYAGHYLSLWYYIYSQNLGKSSCQLQRSWSEQIWPLGIAA